MEINDNECENITSLLNLFMIYFKRKNNMNDGTAMFDFIKREQIMVQTNLILEEFYETIQEYKTSRYKDPVLYNEEFIKENDDIDFFVLSIDDINIKLSDSLLVLLIDVNNYYFDKNCNIS